MNLDKRYEQLRKEATEDFRLVMLAMSGMRDSMAETQRSLARTQDSVAQTQSNLATAMTHMESRFERQQQMIDLLMENTASRPDLESLSRRVEALEKKIGGR